MSLLVVLTALVCAAAAQQQVESAAGECKFRQFRCGDGQCITALHRCDGFKDCRDGSDEVSCDALPEVHLPADNATVGARVRYAEEHLAIELHLCGRQYCSELSLRGTGRYGKLRYLTATRCNLFGRGCGNSSSNFNLSDDEFPPGEIELELQHRSSELAVWRKGQPLDVAVVPVASDYRTLRVRPSYWTDDMPVEFIGAPTTEQPSTTQATSPGSTVRPSSSTPAGTACTLLLWSCLLMLRPLLI
ncbi:uncharacterized protein LOC117642267 isoform X1 [Thrips palmi]|uniref:Uncharacterized protein LOC117642267 isoform X1 n=1 Tax=Thrips palmi TaxID=161013 RepID=A0A6P8ZJY3_THRPL|nr:uncharacterized protein LOC117642267 isoform X1 [Thrips palmi]